MIGMLRFRSYDGTKTKCEVCGGEAANISATLKVCAACVRDRFDEARPFIESAHSKIRESYGLPAKAPKDPKGVRCGACGNDCRIPEGGKGFCGVVENVDGELVRRFGTPERGLLSWY